MVRTGELQPDDCCLKYAKDYKIREYILDRLLQIRYRDPSMLKPLCKVLKEDSIRVAKKAEELAIQLIPNLDTRKRIPLQNALNVHQKREIQWQNLAYFHETHRAKNTEHILINKNKMQRLETVRKELKNSIWFTP